MPENLTSEQQRAKRLEMLRTHAERAIPYYVDLVTPDSVRAALAELESTRERRDAVDDLVGALRMELAGLDEKDARAAKDALRDGKPIPKATNRGPLENKLAEAERQQMPLYELAAEAAHAVKAAAIAVRVDWRQAICEEVEKTRTEALATTARLTALMDQLSNYATAVEIMDGDLAQPWGGNERQWRIMAPRGGITWGADRQALDRIASDRLEYSTTYPGGLPGRLSPDADPAEEHNPLAIPSAPFGSRGW
ncbi:hypothetical protein [Kitasatospora sp. NPDC088548]|uniref:hypothetical protein n=1 Tax=Kitasatospora sp. NPDC088548 TaxID=3364075 RepID=UPI0038175A0C